MPKNTNASLHGEAGTTIALEPSKTKWKSIAKSRQFSLNKAGVNGSETDDTAWQKLLQLDAKRKSIAKKIAKASVKIEPNEFESYYEYFLLNTFRKGISPRGQVNIDNVRSHGKPRARRARDYATRTPITSSGSSASLDSEETENEGYKESFNRLTRIPKEVITFSIVQGTTQAPSEVASSTSKEIEEELWYQKSVINTNISVASILPTHDPGVTGRKSARLSHKRTKTEDSTKYGEDTGRNHEAIMPIKTLYESLVPKIKEPYRRSDWVLPSRLRYTPDKQMNTKVEYEKINLNELVSIGKIQRVFSRFEGGITGIRKTSWNSMS